MLICAAVVVVASARFVSRVSRPRRQKRQAVIERHWLQAKVPLRCSWRAQAAYGRYGADSPIPRKKLLIHTLRWATNLPKKLARTQRNQRAPRKQLEQPSPRSIQQMVLLEALEHPYPLQLEQPVQTLDAAPDDNDDEILLRFGGLPPSKVERSRSFSSRSRKAFGK